MTCPECGWEDAGWFGICDECAVKYGVLGTLVHDRRTLRFTFKGKKRHRTFNAKEFRQVEEWHAEYVKRTCHAPVPGVTFEECRSEAERLARLNRSPSQWLVVDVRRWKFRFERTPSGWRLYDHEAKEAG